MSIEFGQIPQPLSRLREIEEDFVGPSWVKQNIRKVGDAQEQKLVELGANSYLAAASHSREEMKTIEEIGDALANEAEAILSDLRDGRIADAREAAKALAEVQRDVNRLRRDVEAATAREATAWEGIDCTAEELEDRIIARVPSLAPRLRASIDPDEIARRPDRRR